MTEKGKGCLKARNLGHDCIQEMVALDSPC